MSVVRVLMTGFLVGSIACAAWAQQQKDPVDYVSPNIGGIGQLLTATVPYVQTPYGMARLAPMTTPGITDRYLADKIYGFPAGPALLMASTGDTSTRRDIYASDFDHDFETATPYYYTVDLATTGIHAEFTATRTAAYYRFTFPQSRHAHLILSALKDAEIEVVGRHTVEGSSRVGGTVSQIRNETGITREYFYA